MYFKSIDWFLHGVILALHRLMNSYKNPVFLERDKINRQFKLFREGKEKEFQTLIRQREEALKQLRLQQNDMSIKEVLVDNGELRLGRTNSIIDIYLDNQSVTGDSFFEKKKDSVFERDVPPFEELKANKGTVRIMLMKMF